MADRYIPHSRWSGDKRQSSACTPMQSDLWHYYLHGTINTGSHVSAHVFSKRVINIYTLNLFLNLQEQIWLEKEYLTPG